MQIYKKILVTMDCSPVDDAIIEHITALALQNHAQVYLLHVVHSHTLDQERALHEEAEANLKSRCEVLRAKGIKAHIVIRSGEPDTEILEEIEKKKLRPGGHGHPRPYLFRRPPLWQRLPDPETPDQHPSAADRPQPLKCGPGPL